MEGALLTKSGHSTINGDSSSDDEPNVSITINEDLSSPFVPIPYIFAIAFNSISFVMILVQIVAAIFVVSSSKGEHPEATWINVYTCGCIANVPILCWHFWYLQNTNSEIGINTVMIILKTILEYFFMGWSVVFFWVFVSSSSLDQTAPLFWLCVFLLAFGFIRYVLPNLIFAAMCCCMFVTLCLSSLWGVVD